MKTFELVAPCHFGMEAVLKREIYDLGYEITKVEDGRITFEGDAEAICRANIFLRSAERVLLQVGRFTATSFDELFENVKALPWEMYIPKDGKFWVKKASSIKSKLFSPSDIQSIVKKAMVERMKKSYHLDWFPEDGASYPVRVFLNKDEVMVDTDIQVDIQGYDIDADVVASARENAKRAGVDHLIHFQQRAVKDLHHPKKYGFIISNPPYGERLEEKSALPELYTQIGKAYAGLDSWSMYLITSYEDTERYVGRKADKNRKIYNGMIKTYFYQFMGPKPPKRKKEM